MRIYISGKITGLDIKVAQNYFDTVEEKINAAGHTAVNPMSIIPYNPNWKWEDYMAEDLRILLPCDAIFMLENWQDSKGARIEHAAAKEAGMQIFYSKNHNFF